MLHAKWSQVYLLILKLLSNERKTSRNRRIYGQKYSNFQSLPKNVFFRIADKLNLWKVPVELNLEAISTCCALWCKRHTSPCLMLKIFIQTFYEITDRGLSNPGRDSHMKVAGMLVGNFEVNPKGHRSGRGPSTF